MEITKIQKQLIQNDRDGRYKRKKDDTWVYCIARNI